MNIEQRIEQLTVAINRLNETMLKAAQPAVVYAPNPVPQEPLNTSARQQQPAPPAPEVPKLPEVEVAAKAEAPAAVEVPAFAAISAAVQKQAAAGHKDKIKSILAGYKVAKVSELADEHRAAFLAKVEAL